MKRHHLLAACGGLLFTHGLCAQVIPDYPALDRHVALVENVQAKYPAVPPLRTSADGRIGFDLKNKKFYLLRPESLSAPIHESPAGVTILDPTDVHGTPPLHASPEPGSLRHAAVCDVGGKPRACGFNNQSDCYDLTIITPYRIETSGQPIQIQLWGAAMTVEVANPKTATASITSVTAIAPPVAGQTFPMTTLFETMITGDGQLLVGRVGGSHTQLPGIDVVYNAAPPTSQPCDVAAWTQFHPVSHAHHDPNMQGRYGFAAYPLRDPEGNLIPDNADLRGTYPWIDRDGDNLFFTSVHSSLWYIDDASGQIVTRYPETCVPGFACIPTSQMTPPNQGAVSDQISFHDEVSDTRGVSMAGLWTHGKIVLLDGLINNIDYGMRMPDPLQRMLSLYAPNSGPTGQESGWVRAGTGRFNGPQFYYPPGFINNTTFIDSTEHLLNANPNMMPLTPRDVVWHMNTGHASQELAFDDYLNPNGLIFSDMTASMTWSGGAVGGRFNYYDGFQRHQNAWRGHGFNGVQPVRVQNAATAVASEWQIPPAGRVYGNSRIEPVALGGIHGRGLWLDGASGVAYDIPAQNKDVTAYPWYVGLFIDRRPILDDTGPRQLIRFPDDSRVQIADGVDVIFIDSIGVERYRRTLPQPLAVLGWSHIGLLILDGGASVRLLIDGLQDSIWNTSGNERLFQMSEPGGTGGILHLGQVENEPLPGLRGWIDEFKVFAEQPDIEVMCNHAYGTLIEQTFVAIPPGAMVIDPTDTDSDISPDVEPDIVPQPLPRPRRLCHHDYSKEQPAAHVNNIPVGYISLRQQRLFPEGPLHYNQPRPDSSNNAFCLSCHVSSHVTPSLQVGALTPSALLMQHDPRRQPMQPPALIFGHIPMDLYGPGVPMAPLVAPIIGAEQDQWVFP
ncbi:MAG: hypothetical protein Tsb002_07880 [Wenzhouxiangellaceae bacterium]